MKAEFYFRVFGGTVNIETGAAGYAYIAVKPDQETELSEKEYQTAQAGYKKMVASQLDLDEQKVESITKEEYLEETEDDETEEV